MLSLEVTDPETEQCDALARRLYNLLAEQERVDQEVKAVRQELCDRMTLLGKTSFKLVGLGTFSLAAKEYHKVVAGEQERLFELMREHGYEGMIRPHCPAQTLDAWFGEMKKSEDENYAVFRALFEDSVTAYVRLTKERRG